MEFIKESYTMGENTTHTYKKTASDGISIEGTITHSENGNIHFSLYKVKNNEKINEPLKEHPSFLRELRELKDHISKSNKLKKLFNK